MLTLAFIHLDLSSPAGMTLYLILTLLPILSGSKARSWQKKKKANHPTLGFAFAKLFWPWRFTVTPPALLGQVKTSMAWKMVEKKIKVKVKCMQLSFKSKRWLERQVSEIKQVNNRTLWVTGLYLDGRLPVPFSVSVH